MNAMNKEKALENVLFDTFDKFCLPLAELGRQSP